MPLEYYLVYYFYAPYGRFKPCGMFSLQHIISALICLAAVVILYIYFKDIFLHKTKIKGIRITAMILSILELIKIVHSFIYGDFNLDAWFPLSYCGLFIFALWICGYAKGFINKCAYVYITYGCAFAGIAFLIFPTTSLMMYPIWHYFSLYSLLYHSVMIFWSIVFISEKKALNINSFVAYTIFITIFVIPALLINKLFESNLMNLKIPYNIPITFIQNIYCFSPQLYTLMVYCIFLAIPLFIEFISNIYKLHSKKS